MGKFDEWQRDDVMLRTMRESHVIAVVGLSANPLRPSNRVAHYLQRARYRVAPVNPQVGEVLGEQAYGSLGEIPFPVDLVNIFRRSEFVMGHVREAIAVGARAIWLQLGVIDFEAATLAHEAGLDVVMHRCIKVEHLRLSPSPQNGDT